MGPEGLPSTGGSVQDSVQQVAAPEISLIKEHAKLKILTS